MPATHPRIPAFKVGRTDPPTLRDVADPATLDLVFKALANETRRGILAILHDRGGYLSSHDIARRFEIPWQSVSRHLRLLTEAGLLVCDVRRNERAYTLNRDRLPRGRRALGDARRHRGQSRRGGRPRLRLRRVATEDLKPTARAIYS